MRNHILVFTTALVLGACADDQQTTAPKASSDANRSVSVGASSLPSTQARAGGGAGFTITKVQSTTLNLTTGQSGSATATCPAGSQVVGGGYQNNGYAATGDLSFRCNVDYRGAVSDVRIRRANTYRG